MTGHFNIFRLIIVLLLKNRNSIDSGLPRTAPGYSGLHVRFDAPAVLAFASQSSISLSATSIMQCDNTSHRITSHMIKMWAYDNVTSRLEASVIKRILFPVIFSYALIRYIVCLPVRIHSDNDRAAWSFMTNDLSLAICP